jgi:hypothetical protein
MFCLVATMAKQDVLTSMYSPFFVPILQKTIEAEASVKVTGYSLSPFIDVTEFFPRIHPNPQASFSFPNGFDVTPSPAALDLLTNVSHISLSRWLPDCTRVLTGISEDPLPRYCWPRTPPPLMPRLDWSRIQEATTLTRDIFVCIECENSTSSDSQQPNRPGNIDLREEDMTIYSRLSPSWMRPGSLCFASPFSP